MFSQQKIIEPTTSRHTHSLASPSSRPPWLSAVLNNDSSPPRIYRWTPDHQARGPMTSSDPRRIYILGAGNIGRLYAAHLAKHSPSAPPLTLVVHRRSLLEHWIADPGVEIIRNGGKFVEKTFEGIDVEYWVDDPHAEKDGSATEIGPIHNIIIATKAGAAIPEADRLRRYLNRNSTVAFAQNGMSRLWPPHGSAYAAQRYPDGDAPNFAACITTHGIISLGPFRSKHASPADAKIGLVLPSSEAGATNSADYMMEMVATAPGLDSKRVARLDLWVLQLEKLVVNIIINPMTAVLRCKNGVLFAENSGLLVDVMDRLLKETSAVYQALVNHPSTTDILQGTNDDHDGSNHASDTPQESLAAIRARLTERFSFTNLRDMLWGVGYKVGENTSSMLQDVQAGKTTEIQDFNGWVVDTARFLDSGLDVSGHQALIELVETGKTLKQTELSRAVLCEAI